ncbi:hypothetical protein BH23GEM2_BH23GEM2_21300 [soil metagenome]
MKLRETVVHLLRTPAVTLGWEWLANVLVRLGGPKLAARLTVWGTDWGSPASGRPTVVCLMRDLFSKDVEQLRLRGSYNYVCVLGGLTRLQMPFFPPAMRIQTTYQTYTGPDRTNAIALAMAFAAEVLRLIGRKQPVTAVMSANVDYWQDLGFKLVCREQGVPFLALSREHPVVAHALGTAIEWYGDTGFAFEGNGVAVAARASVDMLVTGNALDEEDVVITGLPRLDAWRDVDTTIPMEHRRTVTLLSFTKGYYADDTFVDVLASFAEAARGLAATPFRFVVKCKSYEDYLAVTEMLPRNKPSNVEVVYNEPLFSVLPQSRLVIGFNSLAMAEAALSRAPLCVPFYDQCRRDRSEVMFHPGEPSHQQAITFPASPEELAQCITQHCSGSPRLLDADAAEAIASEFFYWPPDSTITEAVERFIRQYARQ